MDIESIKVRIAEDKQKKTSSYRRYPARFLFMELNSNTQNEILALVSGFGGELLDLSDFIMKKDDGWMSKSRFINVIQKASNNKKDVFVLGFSELIRFFSKKEIESTVLSLFDIENSNITDPESAKHRIYFICFSMMDDVYRVLQDSFPRRELINPFINADYELSGEYREICFVSNEYAQNITKNKITTTVEWIGLWRNSALIDYSCPIWCCSDSLYRWHQKAAPDNAFHIDYIQNAKDYLNKAYGLEIEGSYVKEDAQFWKSLEATVLHLEKPVSLMRAVKQVLSVDSINSRILAAKYLTTNEPFHKWIIRQYVKTNMKDSYLFRVLTLGSTHSRKEFLKDIWQQGYSISNDVLLKERYEIINELTRYTGYINPEAEIKTAIFDTIKNDYFLCLDADSIQDGEHLSQFCIQNAIDKDVVRERLLDYYTHFFKPALLGISDTEKEFIINLFACGIVDKTEIHDTYQNLYSYLYGDAESKIHDKDQYKEYLEAYRVSKINNKDNAYLEQYYADGKANASNLYNMYYSVPHQDTVIAPFIDEAELYIIDGVGAEYLPLIADLLQRNNYHIELCDYATCHLPTITDINKSYIAAYGYKKWFLKFDREVIHGDFYKSATNLRKAFDILEGIIEEIVAESAGKRVVITADHGATARPRWKITKKKYDFSNADHEGRCCKLQTKGDFVDTDDYLVYEDETKPGTHYLASLNEVSLYNRPKYEDHGGATIEELFVPVIIASPEEITKKQEKEYQVIGDKLSVTGLDKSVTFIITPDPDENAFVVEEDLTKHTLVKTGGVFSTVLSTGKEQDIAVCVASKQYKFHISNKSKKNMEGDDGFDD